LSPELASTPLNVVSFLGAIIGVGIVAKNGILMLDLVDHMRTETPDIVEALVRSGRRRLRPVLMTSLAAALGMLPLAYGVGSAADMLKPLAIAVIGALCFSVLLSLIATPIMFSLLLRPATTEVGVHPPAALSGSGRGMTLPLAKAAHLDTLTKVAQGRDNGGLLPDPPERGRYRLRE
jgi:hypothetical protein